MFDILPTHRDTIMLDIRIAFHIDIMQYVVLPLNVFIFNKCIVISLTTQECIDSYFCDVPIFICN